MFDKEIIELLTRGFSLKRKLKKMQLNYYDTLLEATEKLKERGFSSSFKLEGNHLISVLTNRQYKASDLQIVEYHRFEGMSNPSDSSVIFAIETNREEKGVVVMNYSAEADMDLLSFIDKINIKDNTKMAS